MPRKVFQILKVEKLVSFLATGRKLLLELEKKIIITLIIIKQMYFKTNNLCTHTGSHTHVHTT